MKLLVLLLLHLAGQAVSSEECDDCEHGVTCLVAGRLNVCVPRKDCINGTEVLSVDFGDGVVYVKKNDQATIEFDIIYINVTGLSVIATYPNGTNESLAVEDEDKSPFDYSDDISSNSTKAVEGIYNFRATGKYSAGEPGDQVVCSAGSATLYVLTTDVASETTSYFAQLGDNVTIALQITTDLNTTENILIQAVTPNGNIENITIANSTIYEISDVGINDLGEYDISAYEIVDGQGQQLSSSIIVSVYRLINVTTDLSLDGNGTYLITKGVGGKIVCERTDGNGNVTWQTAADSADVSESVGSEVFQKREGGKTTLSIPATSNYRNTERFACVSLATANVTIAITVEGPPADTKVTFMDGTFTCKSSGNPAPTLSWSFRNIDINEYFANPTKESSSFESTSNLTQKAELYCLGHQFADCIAENDISRDTDQFSVNDDRATTMYYDEYIVLRSNSEIFVNANDSCQGRLVTMDTEDKIKHVTQMASEAGVMNFYIGSTKTVAGNWVYPDVSDSKGCKLYYSSGSASWMLQNVSCNEEHAFICEIKDEDPPKMLQAEPNECNGTKLNVTWEPPLNASSQIITINTESLNVGATQNSMLYNDLNSSTDYPIKVEAVRPRCKLNPYIATSVNTTGPPSQPESPELKVIDNTCVLTWSYTNSSSKVESFITTVMVDAVVDKYNEFGPSSGTHERNATTFQLKTVMTPNSNYTATIYSSSCAGNSTEIAATGSCTSPIGASVQVNHPKFNDVSGGKLQTTIPTANNRSGPVTCQFLVVSYIGKEDTVNDEMSQARFDLIKQEEDDVNIGDEYFAYATTPVSNTTIITFGKGESTSCTPLPKSNRKRRSTEPGDVIRANNRAIRYGAKFRYFIVVTVVNGSTVYLAKSDASGPQIIEKRQEAGNHAAVVVLSILAAVILCGIAFYLYRKWRRPNNRPSFLRFSYSRTSDPVYDTL